MIRPCFVAVLAASAACSHSTELIGDDEPLPGLISLEITPSESMITIDELTGEHFVTLVATGHFRDGPDRVVTDDIGWATNRNDVGGFPLPGRWVATNRAGGLVTVEGRSGPIAATATIGVRVVVEIIDPAFPPPTGAIDAFRPPTPVVVGDSSRSPTVEYPAPSVMFPINIRHVLFQYDRGNANDAFRLRYSAPYLDLSVFTTSDRWQPDDQAWDLLSLTNAGDRVEMTVAGVDLADPSTVWASDSMDIYFSRAQVEGAIYYWSTSSQGVMKAALSQSSPTKFYTEPPDTTCVACHTLSRDGRRLTVGYDGERLQEVSVPDRTTILPAARDAGWTTFSPDAKMILVAQAGTLTLIDADSGQPVGPNGGVVAAGGTATHPDWSPLGDHVVVARCVSATDNRSVDRCSIVRIPYNAGVWGTPEVLVASTGTTDNNFFPRYSPDGAWIAYVHASGRSRDQQSSSLRLIPAGGGTPYTLVRANQRVGPVDGMTSVGNTMPTWAPSTHRGTQWLAFSSTRDYGKILVGDNKDDQLWVVALDLSRTGDPSYAAFWLPFQNPAQRNHRAFWALDPEQPCQGGGEVCDGFDNDCNGLVDDDCTPCIEEEICFDHVDNNCDGQIDPVCIE